MRLRNGLPAVTPDRAAAFAAAAAATYHSFRAVPDAAWPLFLSGRQWLHMLDGAPACCCGVCTAVLLMCAGMR